MIRKHWFLFLLAAVAIWYVVHKNCAAFQARTAALKSKFTG
jgi:hypothetical protein